MNAVLWILQFALALLFLAGGAYKAFNSAELATQMHALPRAGWVAIGVFEVLCAVLLVVPAVAKWLRGLAVVAATALALESLGLSLAYARESLEIAVTNPLVWSVAMALLAALLAYARFREGAARA